MEAKSKNSTPLLSNIPQAKLDNFEIEELESRLEMRVWGFEVTINVMCDNGPEAPDQA